MNKIRQQMGPVFRDIFLNGIVNGSVTPRFLRRPLLNLVGHNVHRTAVISAGLFLGSKKGLTIGAGSFVNYGCFMDLCAPVFIGERAAIGYQVMLVTCSHELGSSGSRAGKNFSAPITIGEGVWIGARAVVMPGVSISRGTVIGAGAVVTRDCEPNAIYAGVPARKVRDSEDS